MTPPEPERGAEIIRRAVGAPQPSSAPERELIIHGKNMKVWPSFGGAACFLELCS